MKGRQCTSEEVSALGSVFQECDVLKEVVIMKRVLQADEMKKFLKSVAHTKV